METNYTKIKYLGKTVEILKYLSESENQFNKRIDYIKQLELNNIDWKEAQRLSKIWYCIKYKKCKYSLELYNKIMLYEKE